MNKQFGPSVTIEASCLTCVHFVTERYRIQGDSGYDAYCCHPDVLAQSIVRSRRSVGDTTCETPAWCPLLDAAMRAAKVVL